MAVSDSFRAFVLDQLGRVASKVHDRSMFGGVGIYSGDLFFALIDEDVLYFKVDDTNRADYEERGMGPFQPFGEGGEVMQYYQVPDDVLEDADALQPWVDKAIAVAQFRRTRRKRPQRKRTG
jgi:DNA transformation protein